MLNNKIQKLTIETTGTLEEFLKLSCFPCSLKINEDEGIVELVKEEGFIRLEGIDDIPEEKPATAPEQVADKGKNVIHWLYCTKLFELLAAAVGNTQAASLKRNEQN